MRKTNEKRKDRQDGRKSFKGSFTVEASFVVPILLFMVVGSIRLGYTLFGEAKNACKIQKEIKEFDPVSVVRNNTFISEGMAQ